MEGYILIVDDRKVFRASIKNILIKKGFDTIGISSGKMALERIRQKDIDFVILRHNLPDWSGLKTLKKIKSEFDDVKVICVDDNLDYSIRNQYQENGIDAIVAKKDFWGRTDQVIKNYFS